MKVKRKKKLKKEGERRGNEDRRVGQCVRAEREEREGRGREGRRKGGKKRKKKTKLKKDICRRLGTWMIEERN